MNTSNFTEEKYRDLPYGTIYVVAGTKSSALNAYVQNHKEEITAALNNDETNWVNCQIVCLDAQNDLFPSNQQPTLYSALLPTDEQLDGYTFCVEPLEDCAPGNVEFQIAEFFSSLLQLFDEILDTGHYHTPQFFELAEEPCAVPPPPLSSAFCGRAKSAVCMEAAHFDSPSRLEITPNTYHVLLPDYDREIHFTAQVKALYVLFLNHPEGIRMKEIADYKDEYKQLYFHLTNRSDTDKLRDSVERLLDVCNPNALNVKKSQCNSAIYWAIPESELRHYYEIEVNRGQPHKINLDRALVSMPKILQQ